MQPAETVLERHEPIGADDNFLANCEVLPCVGQDVFLAGPNSNALADTDQMHGAVGHVDLQIKPLTSQGLCP